MESKQVEAPLFPNCLVQWKYKHWLNGTAFTWRYKNGKIIRQIRERGGMSRPTGYYLVLFDGNKNPSRVHENALTNLSASSTIQVNNQIK